MLWRLYSQNHILLLKHIGLYITVPNLLIKQARGFCLHCSLQVHCINIKQTFVNLTSFTSTQPLSAQLCVGNSLALRSGFVWCETELRFVIGFMWKYWPVMHWKKALWWHFARLARCIVSTLLRGQWKQCMSMYVKVCICSLSNLEVLVSPLVIWRNNEKEPGPSSWAQGAFQT